VTKINRNFLKSFKYAKIWGSSANYEGEKVGLRRRLGDNTVITFYLER